MEWVNVRQFQYSNLLQYSITPLKPIHDKTFINKVPYSVMPSNQGPEGLLPITQHCGEPRGFHIHFVVG